MVGKHVVEIVHILFYFYVISFFVCVSIVHWDIGGGGATINVYLYTWCITNQHKVIIELLHAS